MSSSNPKCNKNVISTDISSPDAIIESEDKKKMVLFEDNDKYFWIDAS